jgi:SecD/SecF fusion protein
VTRTILDWLHKRRIIKEHIVMLRLIRKPNINWMKYRPVFFTISAIMTVGGLAVFFSRGSSKYDIEFTGGTSVQINLKDDVSLDRQQVEDIIHNKGKELNNDSIASAVVYSVGATGKQYEINTRETNRTVARVSFGPESKLTAQDVISAIHKAEAKSERELDNLSVKPADGQSFIIGTTQFNTQFVSDILSEAFPDANITEPEVDAVVTNAVLSAFEDKLAIRRNLQPDITSAEKITEAIVEAHPELTDFLGGVVITCKLGLPAPLSEINQRLADLRYRPDMREMNWFAHRILDDQLRPLDVNETVSSFAYVSAEPEAAFGQIAEDAWKQFAENEKTKVLQACEVETSLPQVTQISPSVGKEAKTQALVAIVLSLIAMLIYLAVRFGDLRYGIGAVVKLAHDTCATLGLVSVSVFIAATAIGQMLLIGDFKIDMTMIAAFLTLLGYSINDSIVIYDRIRENLHKGALTPQIINNSINECMSRTLLTGTTTLLVLFVMYVFGGKGLRGFNFTMLFGIIIGTYSSVAISVPILLLRAKKLFEQKP